MGDFGRKLVVWKSVAKDWDVGPGGEAGWPGHRRSFWLVEEVRPGGGRRASICVIPVLSDFMVPITECLRD